MKKYLVTRVMKKGAEYTPYPEAYVNFQIYSGKHSTPNEHKALNISLAHNDEIADDFNMRISLIISADSSIKAINLSSTAFEQALDIISYDYNGLNDHQLLASGYCRNLIHGKIVPLKKAKRTPSSSFKVARYHFERTDMKEFLQISPTSELSQRLKKGLHWSRLANWEQNDQIAILFRWFALEACLKTDDNDSIGPKILFFLGFPSGQKILEMDQNFIGQLRTSTHYRIWKTRLESKINEIRIYRNNSAHAGHRPWDIPQEDIKLYRKILDLAFAQLKHNIKVAISSNIKTAQEMWEYSSLLLENNYNFITWFEGTFLYLLENPNQDPPQYI